jgi:hypothetical protein
MIITGTCDAGSTRPTVASAAPRENTRFFEHFPPPHTAPRDRIVTRRTLHADAGAAARCIISGAFMASVQ